MNPRRKILWAVDPFATDKRLQRKAAKTLLSICKQEFCVIEPVYLFHEYPGWLPETDQNELLRGIREAAQQELGEILAKIPLRPLKPLTVLLQPATALRDRADRMIDYAKNIDADMIVLGTRAKKGPKRWCLGSFAETLLMRSDVPLLVVNPFSLKPVRFKRILFCTDFSDESKIAFGKLIAFAKSFSSEITLFHKIKYEITPAVEVAYSSYPAYREVFQEEVLARKSIAAEWAAEGRQEGVEVKPIVDFRLGGTIADSILTQANLRYGMIAMAAHSGPLASALLGSVTRTVVRGATCPVWVIHTERRAVEAVRPARELKQA